MRKLWLDDIRVAPEGWEHARTAHAAIALLEQGGFVEVSLDHDLGPPEAGTGYDVAIWIEEQAAAGALARLAWNIHSANPVGQEKMTAALRSAERFWCRVGDDPHGASEKVMVRVTVELDRRLVEAAMAALGVSTAAEAVEHSLRDAAARKARLDARDWMWAFGRYPDFDAPKDDPNE